MHYVSTERVNRYRQTKGEKFMGKLIHQELPERCLPDVSSIWAIVGVRQVLNVALRQNPGFGFLRLLFAFGVSGG
jgi:hypothetical protein